MVDSINTNYSLFIVFFYVCCCTVGDLCNFPIVIESLLRYFLKLSTMIIKNLDLSIAQIKEICDRWQITEFALFGSVLRDDFNPTSDIDVLITFAPNARKGLLTLARIKHELEELLGREVDIATKKSIEQSQNTSRSHEILRSAQVIYVA